jgi:hypothetical protein
MKERDIYLSVWLSAKHLLELEPACVIRPLPPSKILNNLEELLELQLRYPFFDIGENESRLVLFDD